MPGIAVHRGEIFKHGRNRNPFDFCELNKDGSMDVADADVLEVTKNAAPCCYPISLDPTKPWISIRPLLIAHCRP